MQARGPANFDDSGRPNIYRKVLLYNSTLEWTGFYRCSIIILRCDPHIITGRTDRNCVVEGTALQVNRDVLAVLRRILRKDQTSIPFSQCPPSFLPH